MIVTVEQSSVVVPVGQVEYVVCKVGQVVMVGQRMQ